ncbi:hypothetical protein COT75_04765 [Candidatus Beckwithbacteria bacterium CG10_big_fil_rev_8_21_14_0_10_34_10]|uniref:Transcriptional regulator n=1 Tax=Candidatus Beckwithbacteria bacterium CG10_big_fil_rev_8_21_14_0_10_34_10 TaxID=1974495 RepID=A0A2H0W7Y3_9BACT|nr:MAG: hypothetical protein COT75_04765 [Candidatus Beckwithbacteria bacterium CG10_big_fil_rev_8_21_14_0_10_34_10]
MKKNSKDLLNRISRIKGQLLGIEKMIKEERSCLSIIQQIKAVREALGKTAAIILTQESCQLEKNKNTHDFKKVVEELVKNI